VIASRESYRIRLSCMDRSKIVAVITGVISLVLAIAYLLIVQIIDFRGEMLPAPVTLDMVSSHPISFNPQQTSPLVPLKQLSVR
jgi:hypothetical protein